MMLIHVKQIYCETLAIGKHMLNVKKHNKTIDSVLSEFVTYFCRTADEECNEDRYDPHSVAKSFEAVRTQHHMSKAAGEAMWQFLVKNASAVSKCTEINIPMLTLKHHRKMIARSDPAIKTSALFLNTETKALREVIDVDVLKYPKKDEVVVWTMSYVSLLDVLKCHNRVHKRQMNETEVVLANDGVHQSKSSSASLDVFTCEFPGCSMVYPISVIKVNATNPHVRKKFPNMPETGKELSTIVFNRFANDLKQNRIHLKTIKADAPKRAFIRNFKGHNSYFACDYCYLKGERWQKEPKDKEKEEQSKKEEIEKQKKAENEEKQKSQKEEQKKSKKGKKKTGKKEEKEKAKKEEKKKKKATGGKIVWPLHETGIERNHDDTIAIVLREPPDVDYIEDEHDEFYGVKGMSVATQFEDFNIISDIPVDSMHQLYLGVVKRLLSLGLGKEKRNVKTKSLGLINEVRLNKALLKVKIPTEFRRATRAVETGCWKASEYR